MHLLQHGSDSTQRCCSIVMSHGLQLHEQRNSTQHNSVAHSRLAVTAQQQLCISQLLQHETEKGQQ